jgi:hypothetical protein
MIFVVGARRSGTNWVQRIINAHPAVVGVPTETYLFSRVIRPLTERFHHGAAGSLSIGVIYMDHRAFLDAVRDLCDAVFLGFIEVQRPGAARLTERTPEHSTSLDLINELYPDASIVHIIRDGRDAVRSLASQHWGPTSIREAAEEWTESVTKARKDGADSDRYIEVRYETLFADPAGEVRRLYELLDLEITDEILAAALLEADVPFNVDPRYTSVGVGKWAQRFSAEDLAEFDSVAGVVQAELGYDESAPAPATPAGTDALSLSAVVRGKARAVRRVGSQWLRIGRKDWARFAEEAIFGAQTMADKFLAAMSTQRWSEMAELLDPAVFVGIVGVGAPWQGRGHAAVAALQEAVANDPAFAGRQVRGDVHPAPSLVTVVATYDVDGSLFDRTFVLTADGDRITRIAYYGFPLVTAVA